MAGIWRIDRGPVQVSAESVQARKAAELARAREERRRVAENHAQRLVTQARDLDSEALIPHTLRLLSRSLKADHVTLTLGPDTRPEVICYANSAGATIISRADFYSDPESALLPPTDGAVSRLHAFVYNANESEPIGCLTVHSIKARTYRSDEVALVDALAELLAVELQRPAGISALRRRSGTV